MTPPPSSPPLPSSPPNNHGSASSSSLDHQFGDGTCVYSELWHACAGLNIPLAEIGSRAVYCPQGHMDQIAVSMNQGADHHMPSYNLPSQLVCRVLGLQLRVDPETDEVYAQYTLLPESESVEEVGEFEKDMSPLKRRTHVFRKILTPSDTSTHGGFSVPKKAARECFPPLDYAQVPPAQELVLNDLHGFEWRFRHIYRGFPKRHLLTTGWSFFVSQKRLVAGDVVIFIRGETGGMRIGIRRASRQQTSAPSAVLSSHSMQMGVLAAAAHAVSTKTIFKIFYNPRTSISNFIIPFSKYIEALKNCLSTGTHVKINSFAEALTEQRNTGTIIGIEEIDPERWPGSKWHSIRVKWDEKSLRGLQERVSPWDIDIIDPSAIVLRTGSRSKRQRSYPATENCDSVTRDTNSSNNCGSSFPSLLQGQVTDCLLSKDHAAGIGLDTDPTSTSAMPSGMPKCENAHRGNQELIMWPEFSSFNKRDSVNVSHKTSPEPLLIRSLQYPFQESCYSQSLQPDHQNIPYWKKTNALPCQPYSMALSSPDKPRHLIQTDLKLSLNASNSMSAHKNSESMPPTLGWSNVRTSSDVPSYFFPSKLSGPDSGRLASAASLPFLRTETSIIPDTHDQNLYARKAPCNQNSLHFSLHSVMVSWNEGENGVGIEDSQKHDSGCKIFGVPLTKDAHDTCNHGLIKTEILKTGECNTDALRDSLTGSTDIKEHDIMLSSNLTGQEMGSVLSDLECSTKKFPTDQTLGGRRCTKVHKQGNAVGRAIDLKRFMGYLELFEGLENMFKIPGALRDSQGRWQVVYTDEDGDMLLMGDEPWEEFCAVVRKIFIFSSDDATRVALRSLKKAQNVMRNQQEAKESSSKCSVGDEDSSSQMTVTCRDS